MQVCNGFFPPQRGRLHPLKTSQLGSKRCHIYVPLFRAWQTAPQSFGCVCEEEKILHCTCCRPLVSPSTTQDYLDYLGFSHFMFFSNNPHSPDVHVLKLWDVAGLPKGNPHSYYWESDLNLDSLFIIIDSADLFNFIIKSVCCICMNNVSSYVHFYVFLTK